MLELLRKLEDEGFLRARTIKGGGAVLEITALGLAALKEPKRLSGIAERPQALPWD